MYQEQSLAALGERVRRRRERMGRTIDQAAVDGSVSPVTWEQGRTRPQRPEIELWGC